MELDSSQVLKTIFRRNESAASHALSLGVCLFLFGSGNSRHQADRFEFVVQNQDCIFLAHQAGYI